MPSSSRTLQHVGEWKVELRADSREELFGELADVIAQATGPHRPPTADDDWEQVILDARDLSSLLVDWGNELIGRSEVSGRAYVNIRNLTIEPASASTPGYDRQSVSSPPTAIRLAADVRGGVVDEWRSPVKAATYHGASVEQKGSRWRGVVLFDV